jgi:hypothetical protein
VNIAPGDLTDFGLAEGYVVLSVENQPIATAESFAKIVPAVFRAHKGDGRAVDLVIKTGDTPPLTYHKPIPPRGLPGRMGDFPTHPTPPGWSDEPPRRDRQ